MLLSSVGYAAIGTITEQVNAPPSIVRKSATLAASKGSGVEADDNVRTTAGKVGITFTDNTKVQINENSKLVIDSFVFDPNNKKGGKLAMNVAMGTVRYASGKVAHNNPDSVKLTTPTATIAVRGTDFTMTVDELGRSTVILLPSCPRGWQDVERDCVTGKIEVITDEGRVIMDKPFQATKVDSKESKPFKPTILNLSEDQINNLLILSPPKELRESEEDKQKRRLEMKGALDVDFLKETGLTNAFEAQEKEMYQDKLSRNFLDQDLLANILDIINAQLAAQLDLLGKTKTGLLPDYVATSGVTVELDEPQVTLCREGNGDVQCITTRTNQNVTITQIQGAVEIKNRINTGGRTTINATQN
jgi:FecR protein